MSKPDEKQAVDKVIDRMHEKFPSLAREHIEQIVTTEHQAFDGNPVRDYVPVLVERRAKVRLNQEMTAAAS